MKKPNSLMVQLSVAVVLISTLVLGLFGTYRYLKNSTLLNDRLEQDLARTVQRLATGLTAPFYEFHDAGIKDIIYSEMKNKMVIGVYLFGQGEEKQQYGYSRSSDKIVESEMETLPFQSKMRSEKIVHKDEVLGTVHVVITTKYLQKQLQELILSDIYQIVIIDFFIAVLMIFVLRIKFIRPITHLTQSILEIKNGNLDQPLCLSGSDEIGILVNSFSHMRDSIKEKISKLNTEIEERTKAEEDLRRSEQRFRELAELLPQTVFELDLSGRLTFLNQYAYKVFGYNLQDFEHGLNGVNLIIPKERDKIRSNLSELMKNGEISICESYTALRKNKTTFPVVIYISIIKDENGPIGYRGIIIDIAEQVKLREEKNILEEQYSHAQKMEAVGRLAGGVAHDLNNMLSPILGYSELLYNDFNLDDPRRKSADGIRQAGLRARDLVRQLLAFGRKQTLEVKPVDLNRVISNFEKLLRRTIRENIEIKVSLSNSITPIMADVGQIEQLIMNLAVNAQDAMPNSGRLTIETTETIFKEADMMDRHDIDPGNYMMLSIMDSGIGMDENTRNHIFEPFFTTKEKDRGTGLGLSTVYGIVKQHGGHIWVDSKHGLGTTFQVYLPIAKDVVASVDHDTNDFINARGNETILVVEDDQMVREMTQALLANQGYTVLTASSGKDAIEILNSHSGSLDLLLTDVILPEINGKEIFMHAVEKYSGIKVLYMSGYADNVLAPHGILEEGINFIQKPFSVQALSLKVRETLEVKSGIRKT